MMGIVVFCFLAGFVAGYLWGHKDGRMEEVGRWMDHSESTSKQLMDMDRLYSQKENELKAELDHYKRLATEKP
jgi:hypothetical protein